MADGKDDTIDARAFFIFTFISLQAPVFVGTLVIRFSFWICRTDEVSIRKRSIILFERAKGVLP